MRRFFLIPFIICFLVLPGCGRGLLAGTRDMERLLPVQTIGLDRAGDGVALGISTGPGPDDAPPLVLRCASSGVEPAIRRLQSYSPEDELFYAHVRYILLGESMAGTGILPLLDWVERSPSMRMDTAMLLVRGSAGGALADTAAGSSDVTRRLAALQREAEGRGLRVRSLREIAVSLLERGCALCLAIREEPAADAVVTEDAAAVTVVPTGYALLRAEAEPVFLTEAETMGAALLTGGVNGVTAELGGSVLEVFSPGAEITVLRDADGAPAGLLIRCGLTAGVLEREAGAEADTAALEALFSRTAEAWLAAAAARAQALGCDFLGLSDALRRDGPEALWASLPVTVEADAVIDRSYDLSEGT